MARLPPSLTSAVSSSMLCRGLPLTWVITSPAFSPASRAGLKAPVRSLVPTTSTPSVLLQGHAHGLPARVQAQIVPNLHRDLTQGQKPQQTDGGPGLRATVQRVAGGGESACTSGSSAVSRRGKGEPPPPFPARRQ